MFLRRRSLMDVETQLGEAVDELAHALERSLEGQKSAARTIAVNLRLMLNKRRGDQLLRRVADAKGIQVAPVWQSQGPQFGHSGGPVPGDLVAFGPSFYDTADDAPPGSIEVTLDDALAGSCLTIQSGGRAFSLTWMETIVTVANKLAVHADDEIPALLGQLDGLIVHNGQNAGFEQVLRKVAKVVVPRAQAVVGKS